ncbi:MAG TPA: ferredoxin, partial [Anaeromyxobacter sp.]
MARIERRLSSNAPGDLFVDDACIACDTCRRIAPATYGGGEDDVAFVARQPASPAARRRAMMALVACPVAAIGSSSKEGAAEAVHAFPYE